MRYRPRPVEIEAIRWTGDLSVLGQFLNEGDGSSYVEIDGQSLFIETLEGRMECVPGNWLIRGMEGEYYPCKDSIFRLKYMAVGQTIDMGTKLAEHSL